MATALRNFFQADNQTGVTLSSHSLVYQIPVSKVTTLALAKIMGKVSAGGVTLL